MQARSPFRVPEAATPRRATEAPVGDFVYMTPQRTPMKTTLQSGGGTPWSSTKKLFGRVRRALMTPGRNAGQEPRSVLIIFSENCPAEAVTTLAVGRTVI